MNEEEKMNDNSEIVCCFSDNSETIETIIGQIFIDFVHEKLKETNKKI